MNFSRNRKVMKKRVMPKHFRRRNLPSISEILNAATYRRRNKELLRNNKSLATALQEAQCVISSNTTMLRNLTRDSNHVLLARLKMRSMAVTIQKLVEDLNDVMQCLDISCMNIPKLNINEDVRLKIPEPGLEKIDESILSREDEEIMSKDEEPLIECKSPENGNSSVTEIYNVTEFLSYRNLPNTDDKEKDVPPETTSDDSLETTPQLNLVLNSRISEPELSQNQNGKFDIIKNPLCSPVNKAKTAETSKIPVRKNLFLESIVMDPPLILDHENRRETFVVNFAENDRLNQTSASSKRGTFTIAEMCREMQAQNDRRGTFVVPALPLNISKPSHKTPPPVEDVCNAENDLLNQVSASLKQGASTIAEMCREIQAQKDRRGTFVVPALPSLNISKPSHKTPPPTEEFCLDDKTIHLSEDMDLTEIIPSATLATASKSLLNKNGQFQVENAIPPSLCKNKEMEKVNISPPIVKMNEISPIAKLSMKSDSNKEAPDTGIETKSVDSTRSETLISLKNKIDLEQTSDDSCEQNAPIQVQSRKSVLPSFVSLSTSEKLSRPKKSPIRSVLSSDVCTNNNISSNCVEKPISENHEIIGSSIISKENINASITPTKSAEKDISFEEISNDSDSEFIVEAPVVCEKKRISGRKSIKPNRKKPVIFKNSKSRKSISKTKENSDLLSEIKEKYDFSSSDSEEESSKIVKTAAKSKYLKKSCSKVGKSRENSTVAALERDINLKLQDQSRKKRSLKRRVSFVGLNASPSKKDEDKNFDEPTEQTLQIHDKEAENRGPRKSILKRKSVFLSEKQGSPSNLNLRNILEHEDLQKNKSAVSEKSEGEKVSSKISKIQEKEIDGKITPIFENSTDDRQTEASQSGDEMSTKTSKEEIKPNKFSLKSNRCKSVHAEDDLNTLDQEENSKPQPHMKKLTLNSSENSDRSRKSSKTQPDSKEETETSDLKRSSKCSRNVSDFFRLSSETSARNKSKRTFSGVSERSSKKRFTANDDILEDIVSNFNEVVPDKILKGNVKKISKSNLNGENIISGATNISNSVNKKDSCSDLKEDSQLKTNELEKHIAVAKSSEQDIKEKTKPPLNLSEKESLIGTNLKLNSKIESTVRIESHNDETSSSSEPMCNSKLNEGEKSADTVTSQYSKTETKVGFGKDLSAGSSLKENFEEKNEVEQDEARVESISAVSKSDVAGPSEHATNSNKEVKSDLVLNPKKRKNNSKAKQSVLNELQPNYKLSEDNKSSKKSIRSTSPSSSKIRKTVSGGNELKENLVIPDLESGGRSRRARPNINFKEPSLHAKLRRK